MKKRIIISFLALLAVSCDKEVFTGLVESGVPDYGKIFVSTNPKGYKLFIDDKYMGVISPDTIKLLTAGIHKLTLKHDVFSDSSQSLVVQKNSVNNLAIDMMKSSRFFAKVICSTNPQGAKIYLNDRPTGLTTPATVTNVYPGEFEIKFIKNLFRDDSLTMKLKGGQYTEVYRILEDTSRTVSYRMNNSGITSNMVRKVIADKNNNKWIGTLDRGLVKFDGKRWTSYENISALTSKNITELMVDRSGKLWVGTGNGLAVFDGASWINYNDKLPSQFVTAIEEDILGNIWIGTLGGLVKCSNNIFQTFTPSNSDVNITNISAVSSNKKGEIWIGTNLYGIFKYDGKNWTQYSAKLMDLPRTNVSDIVKDLIVDKNENLWSYNAADPALQVASALLKFDGSKWYDWSLPILFYLDVNSFYSDADGNIWMSVNGGLIKYNGTTPYVYDPDTKGFFSKQITSFCIDSNGDGWLSTLGGGVARMKKGTY